MTQSGEMDWHALVKYADVDGNKDTVPAQYVKDLKPPVFLKNVLYDVFWSPKPDETLQDCKRRMAAIPVFPEGSGYAGAGYYKAHVLIVAESKEKVTAIAESTRARLPTLKATASSIASSSGISSNSSTRTKRGRPSKEPNTALAKKSRKSDDAASSTLRPTVVSSDRISFEESDEEGTPSQDVDASCGVECNGVVSEKLYNEAILKYKKMKVTVKNQQDRIENLHKQIETLLALNLQYQSHILECKFAGERPPGTTQPSTTQSTQTENIVTGDNTPAAVSTPKASQVRRPILVTVPSSREADELVNISGIGVLNDPPLVLENPRDEPNASIILEESLETTVTILEAPVTGRPTVILSGEVREAPVGELIDREMIEVHPGIFIPKELWVGNFQTMTENPLRGWKAGPDGDREFIKDAALAVWGFDVLATHSVTGKESNANRNKDAPGPTGSAAKAPPALERFKIKAIQDALKRRVILDLEPDVNQAAVEERTQIKIVNKEIGQKIAAIKKIVKRREKKSDGN